MEKIINGKAYNTETAVCIADNEFADGTNRVSNGRCSSLYKTKKGNFFIHYETHWQGEHSSITALSVSEAKEAYENHTNTPVKWEEAFGETPEEA